MKLIKLNLLLQTLEELAPLHFAEPWDNVGLLAGDPETLVSSALLTIDMTLPVVEEALGHGCELVIAYHPPIFEGLKRIASDSPIATALRHGLALYSPHTAFDAADGGVNDYLADIAGLQSRQPLTKGKIRGDLAQVVSTRPAEIPATVGMGRIGHVEPISRQAFLEKIKAALALPKVLVSGPLTGELHKVAVVAGAPGDLLKVAVASGANAVLCGEVRHHDALAAAAKGVTVICTRHSCSERQALGPLRNILASRHMEIDFHLSQCDADPFSFF